MGALELMGLVSKISTEAPVLLPDALKLMTDFNQVMQDFQKLVSDFQAAKTAATPAVAV
jgi:hypothetical protein